MKHPVSKAASFGAFSGVFVPTFLSVIGVILFLRLGYVVGSAGTLGTFLIILLAVSVTVSTGLSLSSITTNIRIGSGGAYSIIRKTLGLEVGGSVGIPLYLAQIFSVALYVFGFVEAWGFIFPEHPKLFVLLGAFLLLSTLITVSARLAVKAQVIVFVLVLAALTSVFLGTDVGGGLSVPFVLSSTGSNFWALFALFFPATTGLMAGIGLSGKLSDPKRQIPLGVMSALGITTIIYICVTLWFANVSTPLQLIESSEVIVTQSRFPLLVLIGILAATFSSALTTVLAAPYLLSAMADNRVLPFSKILAKRHKGDPFPAILATLILVAVLLVTGSLDAVAPILTMFFLITYAMINFAVVLEMSLGSVSFRPTLRIPRLVPLYGGVASLVFMFMISPNWAVLAVGFLLLVYFLLVHQQLKPAEGDARSGLLVSIALWAAQKANKLPEGSKHNWKPSILLPVVTTKTLLGNFPVIKSIAFPNGTLTVLGLALTGRSSTPEQGEISKARREREFKQLPTLVEKFGEEHVFTNSSIVEVHNYTNGICVALESIDSQVFHPNILFLSFRPKDLPKYDLERIFRTADASGAGVAMLSRDDELGLGSEQDVHVWIPESVLDDEFYEDRMFDLALIIGYRLFTNWDGSLRLWMATSKRKHRKAERYLRKLIYEARFPQSTKISIAAGDELDAIKEAPAGDLHIIPVTSKNLDDMSRYSQVKGKSFLYVSDSGLEDVLA